MDNNPYSEIYSILFDIDVALSSVSRRRYLPSIKEEIDYLEDNIYTAEDKFLQAFFCIIKSIYEGYSKNYSASADWLRKAVSIEIESGYLVDIVILYLGVHEKLYAKVFNPIELKEIFLNSIKGFPSRAWELLKLSNEMQIFIGLSNLSEYYKYVLTEHYRQKICLTDDEIVEIIINCKNIFSDILRVRADIKKANSHFNELYEEVNSIHRDTINLQLDRFFDHKANDNEIVSLKGIRQEKEQEILENIPSEIPTWVSIDEIKQLLPENTLYIDYTVIPKVEANKNSYIKDLIYISFALIRVNGSLMVKILPFKKLQRIRYQFNICDGLLREKKGKGNSILYGMLFKEAFRFANASGIVPDALIISGDAELSSLPYDALVDEKGRYLAESYEVINVNSLRNYRGTVCIEDGDEKDAVVIGNPSFTIDQSVTESAGKEKYLVQIPLSKIEAQAVADALGVKASLRFDAKKSLLYDNSCKILHIATHGDHLDADYAAEMGTEGLSEDVTNPLLTNCLFLSGANDWIVRNTVDEEFGNGIVTAEELYTYHLPNLKIVTLSACFTGCGDINYQLGLIGMRTALMATGARAIITNLWEVDDFAAAVFMTRFYNNLKSMTVSAALREAKMYLMNVTLRELSLDGWFGESRIRRLGLVAEDMKRISMKPPETKLFEKPFYWAGFSLLCQ